MSGAVCAAETVMFETVQQCTRMFLPKDHCFAMISQSGNAKIIEPPESPGEFEISVGALGPNPRLPIVVMAIPLAHATAFKNMTAEMACSLMDQIKAQFSTKQ